MFFKRQLIISSILIVGLLLKFNSSIAQTDTEFWFVVPEVTINHQFPGGQPASFRLATGLLPATVTISMPANQYDPATNPTGFVDIVIDMPASSFHIEDVTCWIMSPCSPADATSVDVNRMENKPLNTTGINKFGIHITSTNPITAYYEISRTNNKDIWALKGGNGLGTEFYTPFQTHGDNANVIADTPSAIDVVATEDFTTVTFELDPTVPASYGLPMVNVPAGGTVSVNLMRGETFSLYPLGKSRLKTARLKGTHVTSTRPIAVTLKDDSFYHSSGGCYDIAGDQLVPTNIIGKEYAVIRTFLNTQDHIYVLGTENATNVKIYNTSGAAVANVNVDAGQQLYYALPDPQTYYRVVTDKPVYVWHVGGFGCEQGGAVLPPIDICTGTTQVAFARTSTENFYVIMMVRKGAEDGFKFDGAVSTLFTSASFVAIPSSNWSVARFGPFTTGQIAVGNHFMENTKDIFHLGIVNGGSSSGCFYGYFSDYNELKVEAVVAGTNSSVLKTCYGNPVQLYAYGGTDYDWSPDSTLNDPSAQMPWASPKVNTKYQVVVSGACNMTDTAEIDVLVSTPLDATFTTDKISGCAPLTVNFEDLSTGISSWRYDFGDGSAYLKYSSSGAPDPIPPSPFVFSHTFNNTTADTVVYKVVLLAKNIDGCSVVYEKYITVLPSINANFTQDITQGCNPLAVTFTNASSNNTVDSYLWEFGDGFNQVTSNPTGTLNHTYDHTIAHDSTYRVRMIATSPHGCKDTAFSNAMVYSYIKADFTVNASAGCSPLTVNIDNVSLGDTARYVWELNGTQFKTTGKDTTIVLTNTTNAEIDYTIKLTVYNHGDSCSSTATKTIKVYPRITADFSIPNSVYCNLSNVVFTNNTTPVSTNPGTKANAYSWNFGDGANSVLLSPTHIFNNATNASKDYTITLISQNQFGCSDTASRNVKIYSQLYADFAVSPTSGCSPLTVNIDNNSYGGIVAAGYSWDYGDGTSSGTNLDHTHPYVNSTLLPDTSTITLTITNEGGCTQTLSHSIVVYPSVSADFTPDITVGCNPLTVNFDNSSAINATLYKWNFGDGSSSVEFEPTHAFNNLTGVDAIYPVSLIATTQYGCADTTAVTNVTVYPFIEAQFAVDTSFGCSPLDIWFSFTKYSGITEYRWDWDGNGTTDNTTYATDPAQIFHQYVNQTGSAQNLFSKLTVVNHASCKDTFEIPISVYPEITTLFTPSIVAGCNPLTVDFTNNSVFTGTSQPLANTNFYWNYGDGGSSTGTNPSHIFYNDDATSNVIYNTKLLAVSEYGCADSISQNIEVYNRVESHFIFEQGSNCTPFDVTFTPAAIGALQYIWSYGGAPGLPATETFVNGNSFTRQFTNSDPDNPVTYTISLEVRNDENCPSAQTRNLEVYPIVDAVFNPSVNSGCSDLNVTFSNISSGGNMLYLWNYGDYQSASTTIKTDVSHLFTNRGSIDSVYRVELKTINPNGCRDSIYSDITVHPKVEADFVFAQQSKCTPFYIDLTNTSLNGNNFTWTTFYNGSTTTNNHSTFSYLFDNTTLNTILTDTIKLVSRDLVTSCADSISKTIIVYPRVVSRFDVDKTKGCNPLEVQFSNNSSGLGSYLWEFGDGGTSVDATPANHSYTHPYKDQSQTYTVKLTTTNSFGCQSDMDTVLTVYPLVKADFQWDRYESCTPLTVKLNNSSVSALYKYRWNFGDGSPVTTIEQPVSHTYINSTTAPPSIENHTITLRTSYVNDTACVDSLKLPIRVFPHIYPDFITDFEGCQPHSVVLTNQTNSFNTLSDTYYWSLGTGVNSLEINPSLTYINTSRTKDSTFTVRLRSVSEHGCEDSIKHNVTVHPRPFASMELTGEYISCPPFPVEIVNNSIGTDLTNIYNFGDGSDSTTTSMANMSHTFHNINNTSTEPYQIQLKTVTQYGCDDSISQTIYVYPEVIASYSANPGWTACSPFEIKFNNTSTNSYFYRWNFDDGITSSLTKPTHLFMNLTESDIVFDVNLEATSVYDCFDDTVQQVTVWATPSAHIAMDPPLKVFPDATFTVENQTYPAAASWNYSWTFGDNTFSSEKDPIDHTYLQWGPKSNGYHYDVTLVVESPHCKDSTSNFVILLPADPTAFFSSNIDSACSPMEVHFINASDYADSYLWKFGDGTSSTEPEPIHTYTEPGYYNAQLIVYGDGGEESYYRVYRVYENPIANFNVLPDSVMLDGSQVRFFNTSKHYNRSFWDLGDGTQTDEENPAHVYSKVGQFNINLTVNMDYRDMNGNIVASCMDTISKKPAVWVEGTGVLLFPNAFKPRNANGGVYDDVDMKNEVFHPYHDGIVEYKLMIFSRWGEQIFTSNDVNIGWDGFVDGKPAELGVYMWRAIGKFTNGKTFDKRGSVTLLR
ncbi:MAG: PKD domain-containing protein [Bacteroidales bacterium]